MNRMVLALCLALLAIPANAQQLNTPVYPTVTGSGQKGLVIRAAPGKLYSAYATNLTATAGFLVLVDAVAIPSDGAITPIACIPLPASGAASFNWIPSPPAQFITGITAAVTSANTCFTMTSGVITAFISGTVQQ